MNTSLSAGLLFSQQARQKRHQTAIEFRGSKWSYGDINDLSNRMARWLHSRGVARGGRIAILSLNSPQYAAVQLAAAKIGAIVACLNWRQAHAELEHCVRLAAAELIITDESLHEAGKRLASTCGVEQVDLNSEFDAQLKQFEPSDLLNLESVNGEDIWLVLYTSGTTGWPKGAAISHRAMLSRASISAIDGGIFPDAPSIVWAPMFHMSGTDNVQSALLLGGTVILLEKYDAAELVRIAADRQIGVLPLMPATITPFISELKALGRSINPPRRIGSMPDLISPDEIAEVTRLTGAPFRNTFGSTETGHAPASRGIIPIGTIPKNFAKTQSSMCAVRLIDSEGNEARDGEAGEVAIRGPSLFSGYISGTNIDASMLDDGWYLMGDVMIRNSDGTLDYVDRKKYLIKSGGENIYPAEIERVLLLSPRIQDAVVVKAPSQKWGETPVAFVVRRDPSLTVEDVLAMFDGVLANYKHPRWAFFVEDSELPRNTTGKIQRHHLENHHALRAVDF